MVFHWSLSDSESPQISRTLLSILAYPNNAVIWMVLILFLISNFSSLFPKLVLPSPLYLTALFALWQDRNICLSFLFLSFSLCGLLLYLTIKDFNLLEFFIPSHSYQVLSILTHLLISRGVMVIVIGNGHGDTSSNPGQDWLHFI